MRYFLTGFMGSGKTSIGVLLAKELCIAFVDLDEEIEKSAGLPIPLIFKSAGESRFRELEKIQLEKTIVEHRDAVIATGGGTPCFLGNARLMENNGEVIFLHATVETLADRLAKEQDKRPLLSDKKDQELKNRIQDLLNERAPYYEKAGIVVDADEEPGLVVKQIMQKLVKD